MRQARVQLPWIFSGCFVHIRGGLVSVWHGTREVREAGWMGCFFLKHLFRASGLRQGGGT